MSDEFSVFDDIRMQAQAAIDGLDEQIVYHQHEINTLKGEKRKLQSVIKAASDTSDNPKPKQKKNGGIREDTRKKVVSLIQSVDSEEFTIPVLVEKTGLEGEFENMAESTIARAINVLRDEGFVRQTGVEGRAPVYKWVGE